MNPSNNQQSIFVWDFPVRVFHWLLVISFAGAWLTAESEALQMIHYAFGYSACALVLFRTIWGIIGTRYARFTQFIKSPTEVAQHIKSLLTGGQDTGLGHNSLGALVMVSLMVLILLIGLTGYWSVKELFGDLTGEAHEAIASLTMAVIGIHVAVAIIMSFLQKENLIRSMITGKKQGSPDEAIKYPMYFVGIGLGMIWIYSFYQIVSGFFNALMQ